MSNINSQLDRSRLFIRGKSTNKSKPDTLSLRRNSLEKKREIESTTKNDVKLDIADKVKDFARIKSTVDKAPDIDNSDRIAELREKIRSGRYEVNYDELAEKMLQSEF